MKKDMAKTFAEAFIAAVSRSGWTIKRVADLSGVSAEQLKKVNQGKSRSTNAEDAVRVAAVFGLTLNEFLEDETVSDRIEIVEIYNRLSQEELDLLKVQAAGRRALGQQSTDQ